MTFSALRSNDVGNAVLARSGRVVGVVLKTFGQALAQAAAASGLCHWPLMYSATAAVSSGVLFVTLSAMAVCMSPLQPAGR